MHPHDSRPLWWQFSSAYRGTAARSLALSPSVRAKGRRNWVKKKRLSWLWGRKRAAVSGDKPEKKPCIGTRFVLIRVSWVRQEYLYEVLDWIVFHLNMRISNNLKSNTRVLRNSGGEIAERHEVTQRLSTIERSTISDEATTPLYIY